MGIMCRVHEDKYERENHKIVNACQMEGSNTGERFKTARGSDQKTDQINGQNHLFRIMQEDIGRIPTVKLHPIPEEWKNYST